MTKVVDLESKRPHYVSEFICVACFERVIGVVACDCPMKEMECKGCQKTGTMVMTGQRWDEDGNPWMGD